MIPGAVEKPVDDTPDWAKDTTPTPVQTSDDVPDWAKDVAPTPQVQKPIETSPTGEPYSSLRTSDIVKAGEATCPKGEPSCGYFLSGALRKTGVNIPITGGAHDLIQKVKAGGGYEVPPDQAKAGDIVYYYGPGYGAAKDGKGNGYHVAYYNGDGTVTDSSNGTTRTNHKLYSGAKFIRPVRRGEVQGLGYGQQNQGTDVPPPAGAAPSQPKSQPVPSIPKLPRINIFGENPGFGAQNERVALERGKAQQNVNDLRKQKQALQAKMSAIESGKVQASFGYAKKLSDQLSSVSEQLDRAENPASGFTNTNKQPVQKTENLDPISQSQSSAAGPSGAGEGTVQRQQRLTFEYNALAKQVNQGKNDLANLQGILNNGQDRLDRLASLIETGHADKKVYDEYNAMIQRVKGLFNNLKTGIQGYNAAVNRFNVVGKALNELGVKARQMVLADAKAADQAEYDSLSTWQQVERNLALRLGKVFGVQPSTREAAMQNAMQSPGFTPGKEQTPIDGIRNIPEGMSQFAGKISGLPGAAIKTAADVLSASGLPGTAHEPISEEVYKNNRAVQATSTLGEAGVYALPVVGQLLWGAQKLSLATKVAQDVASLSTDPEQQKKNFIQTKQIIDSFNPAAKTTIDEATGQERALRPEERVVRGVGLVLVAVGGAKNVADYVDKASVTRYMVDNMGLSKVEAKTMYDTMEPIIRKMEPSKIRQFQNQLLDFFEPKDNVRLKLTQGQEMGPIQKTMYDLYTEIKAKNVDLTRWNEVKNEMDSGNLRGKLGATGSEFQAEPPKTEPPTEQDSTTTRFTNLEIDNSEATPKTAKESPPVPGEKLKPEGIGAKNKVQTTEEAGTSLKLQQEEPKVTQDTQSVNDLLRKRLSNPSEVDPESVVTHEDPSSLEEAKANGYENLDEGWLTKSTGKGIEIFHPLSGTKVLFPVKPNSDDSFKKKLAKQYALSNPVGTNETKPEPIKKPEVTPDSKLNPKKVGNHATKDNFHHQDNIDWTPEQSVPNRKPDFVSDSGSEYWHEGDHVIRRSDHWPKNEGVKDIHWTLGGKEVLDGKKHIGRANFSEIPAPTAEQMKPREEKNPESRAGKGAWGATASESEKLAVLNTLTDSYRGDNPRQREAEKIEKVLPSGRTVEVYGPHQSNYMEISELTGKPVRHYVRTPLGVAHVSEVFPDITEKVLNDLDDAKQANVDPLVKSNKGVTLQEAFEKWKAKQRNVSFSQDEQTTWKNKEGHLVRTGMYTPSGMIRMLQNSGYSVIRQADPTKRNRMYGVVDRPPSWDFLVVNPEWAKTALEYDKTHKILSESAKIRLEIFEKLNQKETQTQGEKNNASKKPETSQVHAPVREQPKQSDQTVSTEEGSQGVRQYEAKAAEEVKGESSASDWSDVTADDIDKLINAQVEARKPKSNISELIPGEVSQEAVDAFNDLDELFAPKKPDIVNQKPISYDAEHVYQEKIKPALAVLLAESAKAGQTKNEFIAKALDKWPSIAPHLSRYLKELVGEKTAPQEEKKVPGSKESIVEFAPDHVKNHARLAEEVYGWLDSAASSGAQFKTKLSSQVLMGMAQKIFDGTEMSGAYTAREIYDAMEVGLNLYIRRNLPGIVDMARSNLTGAVEMLKGIMAALPTQTVRTDDQVSLQQFSTPPSEAIVAAVMLGDIKGLSALEPSAGTGNLATMLLLAGAKEITTNEFPGEEGNVRAGLLEAQGFKVLRVDAERIDAYAPDAKVDIVLMNPPFSSAAARGVKSNQTKYGAKHVESALRLLNPGGRLVAIVGQGMGDSTPTFRDWFAAISKKYGYVANILVDGSEYAKNGTTFDNRILVFDNQGFDGVRIIRNHPQTLTDISGLALGIGNGRTYDREQLGQGPTNQNDAGTTSGTGSAGTARNPRTGTGTRPEPLDESNGSGTRRQPGERLDEQSSDGELGLRNGTQTGTGSELAPIASGTNVAEGPGDNGGGVSSGGVSESDELSGIVLSQEDISTNEDAEDIGSSYVSYPAIYNTKNPHPTLIVETASMGGVQTPLAKMTAEQLSDLIKIPKQVIKAKTISDAQLDQVALAEFRHRQELNGETLASIIGDGTGVGKGRTVAAIIINNWVQGSKRQVWFSADHKKLGTAAKDDINDVLGDHAEKMNIPVHTIDEFKSGNPIKIKEGVIIVGYDTLAKPARLDAVKAWLRGSVKGPPVMLFDEAHKAAGAVTEGRGKSTKRGTAVVDIQSSLPNARVCYVSATAADKISNFGYMTRLGLWGPGTAFPEGFGAFQSWVNSGDLAAMEMVARELKMQGAYLSRFLPFLQPDQVTPLEFEQRTVHLTEDYKQIYNDAAKLWSRGLELFENSLKEEVLSKNETTQMMSQFWSSHQQFFGAMLTSFKSAEIIAEIEKNIADGKAPVVSIEFTGESALKRNMAEGDVNETPLEEMDYSNAKALYNVFKNNFPVQLTEMIQEAGSDTPVMHYVWIMPDGRREVTKTKSAPVDEKTGLAGQPLTDPVKQEILDGILAEVSDIRTPLSALDQIILHFGKDNVSELSGRSIQLQYNADGNIVPVKRTKPKGTSGDLMEYELNRFNNGETQLVIFSRASAQGVSFHSSKKFKNQKQRVHHILNIGWTTKNEIQKLGRTHRSNQVSGPIYRLWASDVAGESRFFSALASRMAKLGAMQRGDRSASGAGALEKYDFNSSYGLSAALQVLTRAYTDYDLNRHMRIKDSDLDQTSPEGALKTLFNRMLMLPVDKQNELGEMFMAVFEKRIEEAKEAGTFNQGLQDLGALSVDVEDTQVVYTDPKTKAETTYRKLKAGFESKLISYADTVRSTQRNPDRQNYYAKNNKNEKIAYVQQFQASDNDGRPQQRIKLQRPDGKVEYMSLEDFSKRWTPYKPEEAAAQRADWDVQFKASPKIRYETVHFFDGLMLPHADALRFTSQIVRVPIGGRKIVGAEIKHKAEQTLRRLGVRTETDLTSTDGLYQALRQMQLGEAVRFENGVSIYMGRRFGNPALKVTNITPEKAIQYKLLRIQTGYTPEYFLRDDETDAIDSLDIMLKDSSVIEYPASIEGMMNATQAAADQLKEAERNGSDVNESVFGFGRNPSKPKAVPAAKPKPVTVGTDGSTKLTSDLPHKIAMMFYQTLSPQLIDTDSARTALYSRDVKAQNALAIAAVAHMMSDARKYFDRRPRTEAYAWIDSFERGLPFKGGDKNTVEYRVPWSNSPEKFTLEDVRQGVGAAYEMMSKIIESLEPDVKRVYIENYFGRIWKKETPEQASKLREFLGKYVNDEAPRRGISGSKRLGGSQGFRKKRTYQYLSDGLEAGLVPITDNPIDMLLLKMREMSDFIYATKMKQFVIDNGISEFVRLGQKPSFGFAKVDSPLFDVFSPGEIDVHFAYDKSLFDDMTALAVKLGTTVEYKNSVGRGRAGTLRLGYESASGIKLRYGSDMETFAHELGHALDRAYKVTENIFAGREIKSAKGTFVRLDDTDPIVIEMMELGKLRYESVDEKDITPAYERYVNEREELTANFLHAYMLHPELVKKFAPTALAWFKDFAKGKPVLNASNRLRRGLETGAHTATYKVFGRVYVGTRYVPESVAAVINNKLHDGLANSKTLAVRGVYNFIRSGNSLLNATQLGLSGFHALVTAKSAIDSQLSAALGYLEAHDYKNAAIAFAKGSSIVIPIVGGWRRGNIIKDAALNGTSDPALKEIINHIVMAGGRFAPDEVYLTNFRRTFRRTFWDLVRRDELSPSWSKLPSSVVKLAYSAIFSAFEGTAYWIMERMIPAIKLSAFEMEASSEIAKLARSNPNYTEEDLRAALAGVWDAIDNRFGEMVYDNLFMENMIKDLGMMGTRAFGWNLGGIRQYGGALQDTLAQGQRAVKAIGGGSGSGSGSGGGGGAGGGSLPAPGGPPDRPGGATPRQRGAVSSFLTHALIAGIMTYIFTGERPKKPMDLFSPRNGKKNRDGSDQRVMLPSELKDVYGYSIHLGETITGKAGAGIGLAAQILRDRDFTGTQITNDNDPAWKNGIAILLHVIKEMAPMSSKSKNPFDEAGISVMGIQINLQNYFMGHTAPISMSRTPAMNKAMELVVKKIPDMPKTQEQLLVRQARDKIMELLENSADLKSKGKLDQAKVLDAQLSVLVRQYPKSTVEARSILFDKGGSRLRSPIEIACHNLDMRGLIEVGRVADADESKYIAYMLKVKLDNIRDEQTQRATKGLAPKKLDEAAVRMALDFVQKHKPK